VFLQHLRCCKGTSFFYAVVAMFCNGEYATVTPLRVFILTSQFGMASLSGISIEPMP